MNELNTYIIMTIIAILAVPDEQTVLRLKDRDCKLIHPGHLYNITSKSNLPAQKPIEIGCPILLKYVSI